MRKQFQNLRQKPEHVRKKYAYGTAATVSLSIFLIWGVTMVVAKPLAYNPETQQQRQQSQHPVADLANTFKTGFAGVAASFQETTNEIQNQYEGEARLEIVETERSSTIEEEQEREEVLRF